MHLLQRTFFIASVFLPPLVLAPLNAWATKPKIDPETCNSLRLEAIKFRQSGVLNDMSKGAAWAKVNLAAARLRDIQRYLDVDEQVQFGCRDAKVTAEAKRASEAAARIELNSDADPTAPVAKDPPKPGSPEAAAAQKAEQKKKVHKSKSAKTSKGKESKANDAHPPVMAQSQADAGNETETSGASSGASGASEAPSLPAFGFGQKEVLPWASP